MQISCQTFFCITFLSFVFSAPLKKDEKNEDLFNTTTQSNKTIDTPSLENSTVTSKTIPLENNNENNNEINESISNNTKKESEKIEVHLEKREENIGNEENGEKGEVKSIKKESLEETTKKEEKKEEKEKEKEESKKEKRKKEKSGKPPKKKVSSDLNFLLKNQPTLPNMRSYFTDTKIKDSEEKIENKLSDEENSYQGQKQQCKCTKRNERKERILENDDISQISPEINPDLDSKITSLSKKTRRDNSGDGPKYFGEKKTKKKKKCRRKKKKKIDPIEEDESLDTDQFENLSGDSYVDSAHINHNVNENVNINKNINHHK